MAELMKYRWHLMLIAVLVLAKFIWVPLWQAKQQNWQQYQAISANLDKTLALLSASEQMQTQLDASTAMLAELESQFVTAPLNITTKLEAQKQIEALFTQANIKVNQSAWRDAVAIDGMAELFFDVRAQSSFEHYIELLHLLDTTKINGVSLVEQELSVSRQSKAQLGSVHGAFVFKLVLLLPEATQ